MKAVGAFEAKTHFSQLLQEVLEGNKIIITRHGEKIAMLVPIENSNKNDPVLNAIAGIKALRKGVTLGKNLTIRSMREEGRK